MALSTDTVSAEAIGADDPLGGGPAGTRAERLAERYAVRIRQRLLVPGTRLPSVRAAADRHGVSPATVVAAYDRLQAMGLVQARPQRGFFVRAPSAPRPGAGAGGNAAAVPAGPSAPVDATALIRGMLHAGTQHSAPGMGTLPEAWLDAGMLRRALRAAAAPGEPGWLRYGEPAGDPTLRRALSDHLATLGIDGRPDQIVTTVGATQALDVVARTLLRAGDAVLVDDPGWAVEFERLTRMGMRLLPVPRGPDGPDLAVLRSLAQAHRPRLYVTVSVLHNPTGHSLSPACAHRVLQIADAHDVTIVEDDTYGWFAPPHATRLAALDGLRRTVLVSGFSKIAAPQWRVGFVAAAPALAERLVDSKLLTTLTSPGLLEHALGWALAQGLIGRHAARVTRRLAAARARAVRHAEAAGCRFVSPPEGLFGWVDAGVDTDALAVRMLDDGWLLAPGSLFHADHRGGSLMRINFAATEDGRFWDALRGRGER